MPTVRCPSCRRALSLPEDTLADVARCPLCETVFPVADLEVQRPRPPRPAAPAAPVGAREVPVSRSEDHDLAPLEPRLDGAARRGLGAAAGWLKAMVTFGMLHLMTCGLCGCIEVQEMTYSASRRATAFQLYAGLLILRFVALATVWAAADRFSRRRGLGLARAGAIIALLYALLSVLPTLPTLYTLLEDLGKVGPTRVRPVRPTVWVSLAFTYLTSLCGLIGSLLALRQLARPEVERAFRR